MRGCGPTAGRIIAFGHTRPGDFTAPDEIDLGEVAVLPGLVNAHTHLELSWMRGRIPETDDFDGWIRADHRAEERIRPAWRQRRRGDRRSDSRSSRVRHGSRRRRHEHARDVASRCKSTAWRPWCFTSCWVSEAKMPRASCRRRRHASQSEPASDLVRHTLAPHAPYSVSPALFGLIRSALERDPFARSSVHLGESAAEIEFLKDGHGPVPRRPRADGEVGSVVGGPAIRPG